MRQATRYTQRPADDRRRAARPDQRPFGHEAGIGPFEPWLPVSKVPPVPAISRRLGGDEFVILLPAAAGRRRRGRERIRNDVSLGTRTSTTPCGACGNHRMAAESGDGQRSTQPVPQGVRNRARRTEPGFRAGGGPTQTRGGSRPEPSRLVLVASGGAVGSVLRYLVSGYGAASASARRGGAASFPAGTLMVNVTGSLLIGVLAGLAEITGLLGPEARLRWSRGCLADTPPSPPFPWRPCCCSGRVRRRQPSQRSVCRCCSALRPPGWASC